MNKDFLSRITILQWAFALSLAVHGGLLILRFAAPDRFDRLMQDLPLEIILINTLSDVPKNVKPQALAQVNLAGGGDHRDVRAQSPLPNAPRNQMGKEQDSNLREQVVQMQKQQEKLLTQVKELLANMPVTQPEPNQPESKNQRQQFIQMLAEIEQRIQEQNAKPRKLYISPSTRAVIYAQYYDIMRKKIEDKGTLYFPEIDGKKLYGTLTMIITINSGGLVIAVEVAQSSGQPELDRRAQAIATSAGPFGAFTSDMRKQIDQLALVTRFNFTRDGSMQTKWSEP
ncbi:MAG: TonB family protein [Betaproteobacteria bacterium]|jgi:protein TonB|nr:TonB family protein [Betaproteobacteria bacterium]NBT66636.1 TonB family protein [Betaproteobacteria bacterium]NBY07710.1 TonB family protein [Betaproteobacteria bacterium]